MPPVSRLTPEQAMYHFLSGYTARVAGTEEGVKEPQVAFSACYSAAFLVRHPTVYATMLAERLRKHKAQAWLVNTGWSGGAYGVGSRIKLAHTRAIIDAIHAANWPMRPTERDSHFKLDFCTRCPDVPDALLQPAATLGRIAPLTKRPPKNSPDYSARISPSMPKRPNREQRPQGPSKVT